MNRTQIREPYLEFSYRVKNCVRSKTQGRPGGVVEYQYTRKKIDKIPQNTPKYPQIPLNIPKIIEALNTLNLKFKESDILNTHV